MRRPSLDMPGGLCPRIVHTMGGLPQAPISFRAWPRFAPSSNLIYAGRQHSARFMARPGGTRPGVARHVLEVNAQAWPSFFVSLLLVLLWKGAIPACSIWVLMMGIRRAISSNPDRNGDRKLLDAKAGHHSTWSFWRSMPRRGRWHALEEKCPGMARLTWHALEVHAQAWPRSLGMRWKDNAQAWPHPTGMSCEANPQPWPWHVLEVSAQAWPRPTRLVLEVYAQARPPSHLARAGGHLPSRGPMRPSFQSSTGSAPSPHPAYGSP